MSNSPKSGFALLIIVVAIALMMLLYVLQMDTLFAPAKESKPVEMEKRPWAYEHFLIPPDKTVKKPKAPRPLLTEPFRIAGPAERNGQPRGQVKIAFDTDGRLTAEWHCDYASDDKTHSFTSQMAGNVSVKMDYEDKTGTDETRLFFIGKGDYVHLTSVPEAEPTREKGTVYLIGWLKPDRSAEGFVTITTDQKWSAEFAFKAAP
jgi:hypothetical protein